jgi:hypothetical protein
MADPHLAAARAQLAAEVAHWHAAAQTLADLDGIAAPAAWASLERYLDAQVRTRLRSIAFAMAREADQLATAVPTAAMAGDIVRLRGRLLDFRRRYLQAETVIDFYGEAVNTRTTPRLGRLLRGLDSIAVDSMDVLLRPLGIDSPPVLTYLDKGLGASILRAGVRLWDNGALSPAAAVKITRHNLLRPTSICHESAHQVAHLCHWNAELGAAMHRALRPHSAVAAEAWHSWASEVAADTCAFTLLGYAPVPALADVVDGSSAQVFAMSYGDPHPFAWLRVLFNTELCRAWFGDGPWDALRRAWVDRHPLDQAPPGARHIAEASLPHLSALAEVCTGQAMTAFGGRSLSQLADPRRASPPELSALAARAGDSLYTSTYLQRHESLRILAYNTLQAAVAPERAPDLASHLQAWLERLGAEPTAEAA